MPVTDTRFHLPPHHHLHPPYLAVSRAAPAHALPWPGARGWAHSAEHGSMPADMQPLLWSGWLVAAWFSSPNAWLQGRRPMDVFEADVDAAVWATRSLELIHQLAIGGVPHVAPPVAACCA